MDRQASRAGGNVRGKVTTGLEQRAAALALAFTAERPDAKARKAAGRALRDTVPHEAHAAFERRDSVDPIAIMRAQEKTRLAHLVPLRHARMLASPFAFLRGSAAVMAADLDRTPVTGVQVQACGDMHVANFGVYASAERRLVFAINDFDETTPGPWEWDVKRLATSAFVASKHLGGSRSERTAAALAVVERYRSQMRRYARMGHLEVWYDTIDSDALLESLSPAARERAKRIFSKAIARNHLQVLEKMTDLVDDRHRIVEQAPFVVRETHTSKGRPVTEALGYLLADYLDSLAPDRRALLSRYQVIDVAQKVVGVGSVGTRCWAALLQGRDADDPLFLQVKEAQPSVLSLYSSKGSTFKGNEGHRVVMGQRKIQGSPDIFIGWGALDGVHFYVRQLRDMKGGLDIEPGEISPGAFVEYCRLCGWALALAHAKSGEAAAISGYLGKSDGFDQAVGRFAEAAASENEPDHALLGEAAQRGEVEVAGGGALTAAVMKLTKCQDPRSL